MSYSFGNFFNFVEKISSDSGVDRVNQIVVKTFDNVVVLLLLLSLEQLAKMTGTCKKS